MEEKTEIDNKMEIKNNKDGILLQNVQQLAILKEQENMNMKMEIAHLRERLLARVDNNISSFELEKENFQLKKELMITRRTIQNKTVEIQELNEKYEKSLNNLKKLDQALSNTRIDLKISMDSNISLKKEVNHLKEKVKIDLNRFEETNKNLNEIILNNEEKIKEQHENIEKFKIKNIENDNRIQKLKLKINQMEQYIEENKKLNTGKHNNLNLKLEKSNRDIQNLVEDRAILKGQNSAFVEEIQDLNKQLNKVDLLLSETKAKVLQLTEEKSTIQIHLDAANQLISRHNTEINFFHQEIKRLQNELIIRDENIQKENNKNQDLKCKIDNLNDSILIQEKDYLNKINELENEWKKKYDKNVSESDTKYSQLDFQYNKILKENNELIDLFSTFNHLLKEQRNLSNIENKDDLVPSDTSHHENETENEINNNKINNNNVHKEFDKIKLISSLQRELDYQNTIYNQINEMHIYIRNLEKRKKEYDKLQLQYDNLKETHEKTKISMQRIVLRKQKSDTNASRFTNMKRLNINTNYSSIFSNDKKNIKEKDLYMINEKENKGNSLHNDIYNKNTKKKDIIKRKITDMDDTTGKLKIKPFKSKHITVQSRYRQL